MEYHAIKIPLVLSKFASLRVLSILEHELLRAAVLFVVLTAASDTQKEACYKNTLDKRLGKTSKKEDTHFGKDRGRETWMGAGIRLLGPSSSSFIYQLCATLGICLNSLRL